MKGLNWLKVAIFISISFSILSQMPLIIKSGLSGVLQLIWGWPLVILIHHGRIGFGLKLSTPLIAWLLFLIFILVVGSISLYDYYSLPNIKNMSLAILMLFMGFLSAKEITVNSFSKILSWSCLISGLLLSISIREYAFTTINLNSVAYAYAAKNSASLIIFSCFVIVLHLFLQKNYGLRVVKYMSCFIFCFLILILKSRATILGFAVVCIIAIISQKQKKRISYILSGILIFLLFSFLFPSYLNILIDNILFNNHSGTDLDALSSGRLTQYEQFPKLFSENILLGRGRYYIENFFMTSLVEVGIVGFIPILIFLSWPIYLMRNINLENKFDKVIITLLIVYYLNSLFEEQAPLGPGAKCFIIWLLIGFYAYRVYSLKKS